MGPAQRDNPWDDPKVKAALADGREPSDIMLLPCPNCGHLGYYNEGSHFTCRFCDQTWSVVGENEDPGEWEGRPWMYGLDIQTLEDLRLEEGGRDEA